MVRDLTMPQTSKENTQHHCTTCIVVTNALEVKGKWTLSPIVIFIDGHIQGVRDYEWRNENTHCKISTFHTKQENLTTTHGRLLRMSSIPNVCKITSNIFIQAPNSTSSSLPLKDITLCKFLENGETLQYDENSYLYLRTFGNVRIEINLREKFIEFAMLPHNDGEVCVGFEEVDGVRGAFTPFPVSCYPHISI